VTYGFPPDDFSDDFPDDFPDDGSAGVREPRHPKPSGPVSGAGAKPESVLEFVATLPDPRR
jgi:hypothetical protein